MLVDTYAPLSKILGDTTWNAGRGTGPARGTGIIGGETKLNIKSTGIPFNIPRYRKQRFKLFGYGRGAETYQVNVKPKKVRPSLRGLAKTQMDEVSIPRTRGSMQIPKIVRKYGVLPRFITLFKIKRN